jgi:hypothetical protein
MRSVRLSLLAWVFLLALAARPVAAAEVTALNDSETTGATATPCNCFLPNERVAAWLTAPSAGKIVAVQILWKSQIGAAPDTTELGIEISASGTFPTPGAFLPNDIGGSAVIVGPTLKDGLFNEFRFLDPPTNSIPLSVPVALGQTFVVALEYLNQTSGGAPFGADAVWDADGCQAGRNAVEVIPGGWADACPLGVTGDWVIRALIEEPEPVPATSTWSLALLALLLLAVGSRLVLQRAAAL